MAAEPALGLRLNSIKTPRADRASLMAALESDGETGSGPKFAGDEDRYFLEGIEEVLAQWNPEVGAMPPIDNSSLELPVQSLGKINTPAAKAKAMRAVLRDDEHEESDLETSMDSYQPPRFQGIDDAVFLDGLEEVIPDEEDLSGSSASDQEAEELRLEVDVLKPSDVPQVAVSAGHIRAPRWSHDDATEYVAAEGPSFDEDDALFHEGVEEVVADWSDKGSEQLLDTADSSAVAPKSPFEEDEPMSPGISDTFFLDGLEEVSTPAACTETVGYMPPVDVPPLKSEEKPPRIATYSDKLPDVDTESDPKWTAEDDLTFLVEEDLAVEGSADSGRSDSGTADFPASRMAVEEDDIMRGRSLRLRTSSKNLTEDVKKSAETDTPTNTPVGEPSDPGEPSGLEGVPMGVVVAADPKLLEDRPCRTPNNTPVDSETPNTPVASSTPLKPL